MAISFKKNDLDILSNYKFIEGNSPNQGYNRNHNQLLAIKTQGDEQKLITIDGSSVTCWQRFLSLFNRGRLAYTTVTLSGLSEYFEKHDIAPLKETNHLAFNTICEVANRYFFYKNNNSLMGRVSDRFQHGLQDTECNVQQYEFFINPRSNAFHILEQVKAQAHKKLYQHLPKDEFTVSYNIKLLRKNSEGLKNVQWNERVESKNQLNDLIVDIRDVQVKRIPSPNTPVDPKSPQRKKDQHKKDLYRK